MCNRRKKETVSTEIVGNRIASASVSCQHSSHPASTARSLSTGEGAEEDKAELPSAAAAGLAKSNVRSSNQLSHNAVICRPVWRCSLMECTEGEPLRRGKFGCRQA